MADFKIRIENLDEFRKGVRKLDTSLGKEFGKVHKEVGAAIVRWSSARRSRMASQFGSYDIVKVKPSANQRQVQVSVGPASAETGIRRHPVYGTWRDQSSFVRRVWPAPNREGWLVRPTVEENRPKIGEAYLDAITVLANKIL